jgi:hypothetical protein
VNLAQISLFATAVVAIGPIAAVADTPTTQSSGVDVDASIQGAIYNMRKLRDGLPHDINGQRVEQTAFDSGIISLGTASVATAFFTSSIPAVGAIAIAAQGLQQFRSYYNPEGQGAALIKAVAAARCVSSSAEPLLNVPRQQLWQSIANLQLAVDNVNSSSSQISGSDPVTTTTQDAATKAITAATTALATLNAEAGAYNNATSVIDEAHDAIKNYMDQKKHRTTSIDFGAVAAAINSGVKTAATSIADAQTARSQLVDAFKASAKSLAATGAPDTPPPVASAPQSLAMAAAPIQLTQGQAARNVTSTGQAADDATAVAQSASKAASDAAAIAAKAPTDKKAAAAALAAQQTAMDARTAANIKATEAGQAVASSKAAQADDAKASNAAAAQSNAEQAVKAAQTTTGKAAAAQALTTVVAANNASAVSALVTATSIALEQIPNPQYTTVNSNITLCVAGLQ